jgi:hypothetical protein
VLELDHVIFAVSDFDEFAGRLRADHGLGSVPGGAHPGHGTGNRIVPLGPSYIELMSVVDGKEASGSPLGRWMSERVASGEGPAALCLRTDDISREASRLGLEPIAMSRRRPDGVELSWHLVGLDHMLEEGLPFFIEWHVEAGEFPGAAQVAHEVVPTGIEWVEIGASIDRLANWLGPNALDLRGVPGRRGVQRIGVGTSRGTIVFEGDGSA